MSTRGTTVVVTLVGLVVAAVIGLGARSALQRVSAAIERQHAQTEQLLRGKTTPSPIDRVRAELEK